MTVLAIIFGLLILTLVIAWLKSEQPAPPTTPYKSKTEILLRTPANWAGTMVDGRRRFINTYTPFYQNYLHILKWLPSHFFNIVRECRTTFPSEIVSTTNFLSDINIIIFLGHASFYLNINGVRILIDPHFHNTSLYGRHVASPVAPGMFSGIDLILLSHDHADHCDKKSLLQLLKNNPSAKVLSGLGMEKLLYTFLPLNTRILTAEWYQQFEISESLKIYFVPAQHYSKRVMGKFNERLWGGFVIEDISGTGSANTIYFAGDSGYAAHFHDIGKVFDIDLAIIGIGAHRPEWFMKPNHCSPALALQAFEDCGAKVMVPMHYGCFNLSNEPMREPLSTLRRLRNDESVVIPAVGRVLRLDELVIQPVKKSCDHEKQDLPPYNS